MLQTFEPQCINYFPPKYVVLPIICLPANTQTKHPAEPNMFSFCLAQTNFHDFHLHFEEQLTLVVLNKSRADVAIYASAAANGKARCFNAHCREKAYGKSCGSTSLHISPVLSRSRVKVASFKGDCIA